MMQARAFNFIETRENERSPKRIADLVLLRFGACHIFFVVRFRSGIPNDLCNETISSYHNRIAAWMSLKIIVWQLFTSLMCRLCHWQLQRGISRSLNGNHWSRHLQRQIELKLFLISVVELMTFHHICFVSPNTITVQARWFNAHPMSWNKLSSCTQPKMNI